MNKQALLKWVESLPDDVCALPLELNEVHHEDSEWKRVSDVISETFDTVYEKTVRSQLTLRLTFSGQVRGEFQRDYFGNPHWANVRRIGQKERA